MNIEEAKKLVRGLVFNDDGTMVRYIDFTEADYDTWGGYTLKEYAEAIETLLTAYEKEKEKNEELENKLNHKYKKVCPECGNWFISKRSDAKHCQKCTKKIAHKRYRESNRAKINEYSKLHMREYRAKKKLAEEE